MEEFSRSELLLGAESLEKLSRMRVAVFGVGGVGGFVVEALARCGIGELDLFDSDEVSVSNINRQIIALHSTVGRKKVDVMRERVLDINPNIRVNVYPVFYLPENADDYDLSKYDYVVDAVDTVSAKLEIIVRCKKASVPVISAMGAGNKLDPTRFEVSDIYKTSVCPLAKVMRKLLKERGVQSLKVVYSKEEPVKCLKDKEDKGQIIYASQGEDGIEQEAVEKINKRSVPGSVSFVPPVVGMIIAGEVIKELTGMAV